MTEKRFTFRVVRDDDGYDIIGFDIDDLDEESSYFVDTNERCVKSLVELLNALHEDNEQLKSQRLQWITNQQEVECLTEENEQLKSLLECSREEANDYCEELMERDAFVRLYEKQNEQLKNELDCFKSSNDILQKELIKKVEEKAELKTQNQGLQFIIIDMLDFVKDKGTVTREEMKEWWNNNQRGDYL